MYFRIRGCCHAAVQIPVDMISAIAIDDEPLALEVLKGYCNKTEGISLVRTFANAGTALKFIEENPIDLLFLDINMPAISGIEFYKKVSAETLAIFTTAYSEYAVEGFDLKAMDYLLKPFDYERFCRAIDRVKEYKQLLHQKGENNPQYLYVKVDYSITKILLTDIKYIEGQDNYIKIHLENGKYVLVRMSMKTVQEQLPAQDFVRVHRSYIVPFKKVTSMRNKNIYMGTLEIPISGMYMEEVQQRFS